MVISNTEPSTHSSFLHSCKNTQNLSSRPIISGCDSPTERISAFVDSLLQPIMKEQQSYIKDTTQFINFIAGTRVPQNAILVSMDVISLYTNIPQEEGITTIYIPYICLQIFPGNVYRQLYLLAHVSSSNFFGTRGH